MIEINHWSISIRFRRIKNFAPDRFNNDRTNAQNRTKEQSRSLPRMPLPVCYLFWVFRWNKSVFVV